MQLTGTVNAKAFQEDIVIYELTIDFVVAEDRNITPKFNY